jgi:hypothetical protein
MQDIPYSILVLGFVTRNYAMSHQLPVGTVLQQRSVNTFKGKKTVVLNTRDNPHMYFRI